VIAYCHGEKHIYIIDMDLARHGLGGPKQKYSPPPKTKMKPINPFGLGLMFFARFNLSPKKRVIEV